MSRPRHPLHNSMSFHMKKPRRKHGKSDLLLTAVLVCFLLQSGNCTTFNSKNKITPRAAGYITVCHSSKHRYFLHNTKITIFKCSLTSKTAVFMRGRALVFPCNYTYCMRELFPPQINAFREDYQLSNPCVFSIKRINQNLTC